MNRRHLKFLSFRVHERIAKVDFPNTPLPQECSPIMHALLQIEGRGGYQLLRERVLVKLLLWQKSNDQIFIKQGTPLCLIVPFKREKFTHRMVDLSAKSKYRGKFYKIYKRHYLKTYGSEKPKFRQDYWKD